MKYDVEADWLLLYTCNFRCPYCFRTTAQRVSPIKVFASAQIWEEGFLATEKTWLLQITGGEPTIYPDFVELCGRLTQHHYLSLNSNLSHPCIMEFAQKINPERVSFINAAIHFEERSTRGSFQNFIARVHELKKANFNVLLSIIMTPFVIYNFDKISQFFEKQGLHVIPKVIRGKLNGRHYPQGYSNNEKDAIRSFLEKAKQQYSTMLDNMAEPPTVDMFSDDSFLDDNRKDYRGKLCRSGEKFVKITPEGTVVRCYSTDILGNIISKQLRLFNAPQPCNTFYCPYFCEKYTL